MLRTVTFSSLVAVSLLLPRTALAQDFGPFDSRKIPIELQAWWVPNFGHIHAAARLPLGQVVSGTLDFDVRIVIHNNPGLLDRLELGWDNNEITHRIPVGAECPYDGVNDTNCAFNVPVSIDTTEFQDGWRELRLRARIVTPDDQKFLTSSGIPMFFQNGNGRSDYNRFCDNTSLIGRGWYDGFGYTVAFIECVPLEPISGVHTFNVRGGGETNSHITVALDKTHFVAGVGPWPEQQPSKGQILLDQDGDVTKFIPVTLDTRTLADGWHSLAVNVTGADGGESECDFCKGEENNPHGVAKIWFYVSNGNAKPAPASPTTTTSVSSSTVPTSTTTVTTAPPADPDPDVEDTCGDADADGDITITDALQMALFMIGEAACALERCDVTGDGKVGIEDVIAILLTVIGEPAEMCDVASKPGRGRSGSRLLGEQ